MRPMVPRTPLLVVCAGLATLLPLVLGSCRPEPSAEQLARRDSLEALPAVERLPDGTAGDVVRRALEAHGGWEAWSRLPAVEYRKTTVSFDDDGAVVDSAVQQHRYALHPERKIRIDGVDDRGREVVLANDGPEATKLVDGRPDRALAGDSPARAPTDGSHYVFSQPFKLTDAGAAFEDLGIDTLPDGAAVHAVRVRYDPGVGRSGGLHTWVYYFDVDTNLLAGYRFGEGDAVDPDGFTRHGNYRTVEGVELFGRRTAYRVVGEDSIRPVRVYLHEDHQVVPSLPDSIFRPARSGG